MSFDRWVPVYVAIGSNLQGPLQQVVRGFDALATIPRSLLVLRSSYYLSAPLGPQNQPEFVNAVAGLLTQLKAEQFLGELKRLERELGREDSVQRWGPRIIDFDLLVYGNTRLSSADLTIPHPGIPERAFVVYPLVEIAPTLEIPGFGRLTELQQRLDHRSIKKVDRTRGNVDPQ